MMNQKFILDACCGGRTFWFDKEHPNTLYVDKHPRPKGTCKHRPNFCCDPDMVVDFTNMPFEDKSFKLVVFDPPHLLELGKNSVMRIKYGSLRTETWPYEIGKGFEECWRVLDDFGVLVFKWNEAQIPIKKVLSLFSVSPLFGHPTSKHGKTKWFVFMKIPGVDE